jgi:type II secretory pathway predicted ATPase ExeA
MNFLQLSKQPFANDILTHETFFKSPEIEKITENLKHQIQFSHLTLIIEGPFGSGKTSLFRNLIQEEIQNTKILSIQSEATDTLVQIQQKMSIHLMDLGDANHLDDNLKNLQTFD